MNAFRAKVRAWLRDAVPAALAAGPRDDVEVRRDWDRRLFEAGYAGLSWPVEHGGQGLTTDDEFVLGEESAYAGAPEGYGRVGRLLTGPLLVRHGSADQHERYLGPILEGNETWCQGFSEPEAGSDLAAVRTTAKRDGATFIVTGQKVWISFAEHADRCLLLARTSTEAPRHRNLGMFLLDMDQPGVEVRPIRQISGDSRFSEVYLNGAVVHERDLVGHETEGWAMAMRVLTEERGGADAITRYVSYLADVELLKTCCAPDNPGGVDRLRTRVELIRWHALRGLDHDSPHNREIAMTGKLLWSATWQDLAAFGVASGCAAHEDHWRREYLESRGGTIFSGTTQVHHNLIAERLLGLPR